MLVAAFVLGFSSCKKEESFNSNDLIGSWSQTEIYYIYKIDGKVDEEDHENMPAGAEAIFTFKEGGALTVEYLEDGELWDSGSGRWSLSGKTLRISGEGDTNEATVEKLTSTSLVISYTDHYVEDGVTYDNYERISFTKVK